MQSDSKTMHAVVHVGAKHLKKKKKQAVPSVQTCLKTNLTHIILRLH